MSGPAYDQEFLDFLLNSPRQPVALPLDEDVLDLYGKYMTQDNKLAGLNADLSWLIMNDRLSPSAYEPVTTYEPVNASGQQRLEQYMQGTPLQQFLASAILGATDTGVPLGLPEIMGRLQRAVEEDPEGELAQSIPTYQTEYGDVRPDYNLIQQEAGSLIDMSLADEAWDGTTVDPRTGLPARAITEDSEAMQKLRALGYTTTPGVPFTQEQLATPEMLARAAETSDTAGSALDAYKQAEQLYGNRRVQSGQTRDYIKQQEADTQAMLRQLTQQRGQQQTQNRDQFAESQRARQGGRSDYDAYLRAQADAGTPVNQSRISKPGRQSDSNPLLAQKAVANMRSMKNDEAMKRAYGRQAQARSASNRSREELRRAAIAAAAEHEKRMVREAMVRRLTESGITPFSIENAQRSPF